jgi:NADPH2:quinone reductase
MQAVIISSFGDADVLTIAERPVPECALGQLLIKVAAAGVNRADVMQRQGKYPAPADAPPDIAGLEVSGTVVALHPSCVRYRIGDRVMALLSGGGYAEYAVALEDCCLPVPDNISLRDAAALPEALFTVWANLFIAAQVQPGDHVLVHGGTSGIGSMAIQMLRAYGAVLIVTAAGAEKTAWCIQLGAALAIDYQAQDFVAAIADRTQGRGVDVILDMVGGDYLPRNLACLAPQGRLVSISTLQGTKGELDIRTMMRQRAVITGTTLRGRSGREKARLAHAVERQVLPWVTQGKVKPLISHYFSLNNAAAAHKTLESGASRGKVVLEVGV